MKNAEGARVDAALEKRQVERAYELYAPVYDFIFDWIFAPGRVAAVKHLDIQRGDSVLEVGIGTGLNLPLYPPACRLTGIDLSAEMLDKAVERVQTLAMPNVTLKVMDATSMDFADDEFDKAVATYTISAVPDPVAVLREMRRVVKPGGVLVTLNHFRSERRVMGWLEDLVAPLCTRLGWKSNLALAGAAVDRSVPAGLPGSAPLVLVHGFAPEGKDDARVREAATLLARCGFDVAVPTIPGLTRGRLGSNDVAPVVATLAALASPSVVLGVSVGAGPALLAAADPRVRERVRAVVSVGGYASARGGLRFWLTGAYEYGGGRGRGVHDPALGRAFGRAHARPVAPAARARPQGA